MPQVQNINLPQIFLAARQARESDARSKAQAERAKQIQAQNEMRQEQFKIEQQLPGAREQAAQGNVSLLQQLAPQELQQQRMDVYAQQKAAAEAAGASLANRKAQQGLVGQRLQNVGQQQKNLAGQAKGQTDAAEAWRQKSVHSANVMLQLATTTKNSPESWPRVQQQLAAMGKNGIIDPGKIPQEMPPPERLDEIIEQSRDTIAMLGDEKASQLARQLAESKGMPVQQALTDPEFQQELGEMLRERSKPAQTIISVGGAQPVDKAVKRDLQKSHIANKKTLMNISELDSIDMGKFLTYQGRAATGIASLKDMFNLSSEADKALISEHTRARETVEKIFNEYRKQITGAAASVQELASLKKAALNMDQSPAEFAASVKRFKSELLRTMRLERKILRGGLNLTEAEFGQRLDQARSEGADANTSADINARSQELRAGGVGDATTFRTLAAEGYITRQQADAAIQRLQRLQAQGGGQ